MFNTTNITKLLMVQTGSYNKQHARPFQTSVESASVVQQLQHVTDNGRSITRDSLSGLANEIIRPSTEAGRAMHVTNGWDTPRLRFMMEVEEMVGGILTRKIVTGFSDYIGATVNGNVDPNMKLYINNVLKLQPWQEQTPLGPQTRWRIVESSQILSNDLLVHANGMNVMDEKSVCLRPEDVFANMELAAYIPDQFTGSVYDNRQDLAMGVRKSNRVNNDHSTYLASTLGAMKKSIDSADGAEDTYYDITNKAKSKVRAPQLDNDSLLGSWQYEFGYNDNGFITYGALRQLSPQVDHVTEITLANTNMMNTLHTAGSTEYWHGSTTEHVVAAILKNTLPNIVMDSLLTKVEFHATNNSYGGEFIVTPSGECRSFLGGDVDQVQLLNRFIEHIRAVVMPEISRNNQFVVELRASVDILGDTFLGISINGQPEMPFCDPTFMDAITAPVVGDSQDQLTHIAHDIDKLASSIDPSSYGTTNDQFDLGGSGI